MKAVFFDLDGTLLHTLPGITKAINAALSEVGVPFAYDEKDVTRMIGRGVDNLMRMALGDRVEEPGLFWRLKEAYLPLYAKFQIEGSEKYPGIDETIKSLKEKGYLLFVYTNKPEKLAFDILNHHFPERPFSGIAGQLESRPVKPNPEPIFEISGGFCVDFEESWYVGDSVTDAETAEAAGLPLCLCEYGYGRYDEKLLVRARLRAPKAVDIGKILP